MLQLHLAVGSSLGVRATSMLRSTIDGRAAAASICAVYIELRMVALAADFNSSRGTMPNSSHIASAIRPDCCSLALRTGHNQAVQLRLKESIHLSSISRVRSPEERSL